MNLRLASLSQADVVKTKELIADVVLEFYGDLGFLPKTRTGLLEYYEGTGYLRDLDDFATEYGTGTGAFFVLKDSENIHGSPKRKNLDSAKFIWRPPPVAPTPSGYSV
jgi:hypothetical protein